MPDQPSDQELVAEFLEAIGAKPGTKVAAEAPGITSQDISRWRRGDWEWLSTPKRRALLKYLERAEGGAAAEIVHDAAELVLALLARGIEHARAELEERRNRTPTPSDPSTAEDEEIGTGAGGDRPDKRAG